MGCWLGLVPSVVHGAAISCVSQVAFLWLVPTSLPPPQALVLLQLWANLDVLLVASWQELSQHVCAITKALAQYPLKCVMPRLKGGRITSRWWCLPGLWGAAHMRF